MPRSTIRIFIFDAALIVLMAYGFIGMREKATIANISFTPSPKIMLQENASPNSLQSGDEIQSIAGTRVHSADEIELLCDRFAINDTVAITVQRGASTITVATPLVQYYDTPYFAIVLLSGLIFVSLGIIVIMRKPDEEAARVFHGIMMSAAAVVMLSPGRYTIAPQGIGTIVRIGFGAGFAMIAVLLVHFTLVFPRRNLKFTTSVLRVLYGTAAVITIFFTTVFLFAVIAGGEEWNARYILANDVVNWFFVVCIVLTIAKFFHSYRIATADERRRKLRWVFAGLIVGPLGVVVFYFAPVLIFNAHWISEEATVLIGALSAVLFAVAIVRNRVLDIEFLVARSTAYGIVLTVLAAVYAAVVGGFALVIETSHVSQSPVPAIVAAVLVGFLFTPVRVRVQRFVDSRFYRVQYIFREAQRGIVEDIAQCIDVPSLAKIIIDRVDALIPVERIGFLSVDRNSQRVLLEAQHGLDDALAESIGANALHASQHAPLARDGSVEAGADVEPAAAQLFDALNLALVFSIRSEHDTELGVLALGKKKSAKKFTMEDIDVLRAATTQAGVTMDRIRLRDMLLLERAESQRLAELSEMKSYFVSSVSHELKTPLTSIRLYAELLGTQENISAEASREYLAVIEGEGARLARLIDNVLDFAKIERGTTEYHYQPVDINEVIAHVLRTMEYQFKMHRFAITTGLDQRNPIINADADALAEAMINLLSNAIKYSGETKEIVVSTDATNDRVILEVRDRGIGMSAEDIAHAFEPFFRSREAAARRAGGAGLGLALVRSIMEAHHGEVVITSSPGEGTTVNLFFPKNSAE